MPKEIKRNNRLNLVLILLTGIFIVLLGFFAYKTFLGKSDTSNPQQQQSKLVLINGDSTIELNVEYARTEAEQEKGLMYRTSLGENDGMIFIFDVEKTLNFWMKNTLIPLDILYFDAKGNLVSVTTDMKPCGDSDFCQTYPSAGLAKYAIEVNAGWVVKNNVGQSLKLDLTSVR